jgi:DNA polymerase III epsilon subunit-like protein
MFIFLDTETTGTDLDDRLCQIAFKTEAGLIVNELFNPGKPISIEAMSIHHITNEMVMDKPPFKDSKTWKTLTSLFADTSNIMVAHNAKFDVEMLRREDIQPQKTICTYKMARFLDKDGIIPQYNLQYLRYYLSLNIDASPHNALGDILVLEALFQRIYAKANDEFGIEAIEKMIEVTQNPVLLPRMPFGKHKGMKFEEIPTDYLEWLFGTDLDEDMAYTFKHYLGILPQN